MRNYNRKWLIMSILFCVFDAWEKDYTLEHDADVHHVA